MGEIHREIMQISRSKGITLIGSGYNPVVLPYGWISIILGLSDIELSLEEPISPPFWINDESISIKTKSIIKEVKEAHSAYWTF